VSSPDAIAADIVNGLCFSSNRMRNGRLVGEQHFAYEAIQAALAAERAETERLEKALFSIQCQVLDWGTNKRLSAQGLRRRLMQLRENIIAIRAKAPESITEQT
jgi:hypothetical protein